MEVESALQHHSSSRAAAAGRSGSTNNLALDVDVDVDVALKSTPLRTTLFGGLGLSAIHVKPASRGGTNARSALVFGKGVTERKKTR